MLENLAKIITAVAKFTNKHFISSEFHIQSVGELWGEFGDEERDASWAKFEKRGGVYCIMSSDSSIVKYIGMSQSDTGQRLFQWLFPYKSQKKELSNSLESDDLILSIVLADEPYMSPALESYLIAKINPKYNQRK